MFSSPRSRRDRGARLRQLDFLVSWPHKADDPALHGFLAAFLAAGFFFGPVCAPCVFCAVCCNRMLKAHRTSFDMFLMGVVLQLQVAMFVMFLNTMCAVTEELCLAQPSGEDATGEAESNAEDVPAIDTWGPAGCYVVIYLWLAGVLARHFRSLTSEAYNPLPVQLRRLQGVQFDPPLQPTASSPQDGTGEGLVCCERKIRDIPALVDALCWHGGISRAAAHADVWDSSEDEEGGAHAGAKPVSAVDYAVMQVARYGADAPLFPERSSLASPSGLGEAGAWDGDEDCGDKTELAKEDETNWRRNLVIGFVMAAVQLTVVRVALRRSPAGLTNRGKTIFWLSTIFWGMMFTMMWSVIAALVHIYARQWAAMSNFTVMTDVYEATHRKLHYLDVSSTRNIILWFEMRNYLVDQVMQPTSFLRAVFDPTCALMAVVMCVSCLVLVYWHLIRREEDVDEFSAGVMSVFGMAIIFFFTIVMYTRAIQRTLLSHGAFLAAESRRIVERLTLSDHFEDGALPPDEAPPPARSLPPGAGGPRGAQDWRAPPRPARGDERQPPLAYFTEGCAARLGEAEYLMPRRQHHARRPSPPASPGASALHHRRRQESSGPLTPPPAHPARAVERALLLRRLRLVEAMTLHVTQCTHHPQILGLTLNTLLQLFVVAMLVLATIFAHIARGKQVWH
eukprot:TRINITY_DN22437_c0_g1_i1.p1 TRINITY_DN22437_c0_g1~~TRINITY_DN22437_c0_g1_i1.p1  ORF type:complete len:679 (+),score=221.31 TRINITY_DN22437_c0_g1_i1:92-2128(+)